MKNYSTLYLNNFSSICSDTEFKWGNKNCDIDSFFELLVKFTSKLNDKSKIFFYGNGASHSFAEHMSLDWSKNGKISSISLSNNALLTALSNDYSYEESFTEHLKMNYNEGDFIVTISSSGNSPNIKKIIEHCNKNGISLLSLSGLKQTNFSKENSSNYIFVPAKTYGFVECAHQLFLHLWLDKFMNILEWERDDEQNMDNTNFNL